MYYPAMPSTLYRYLTRELLSPFLLGLFIFTGLLLVGRMLKLVDMVVSKGVPVSELLLLILYLLPNFAVITIPMALLLGVLLAFSRLSADSEIIAIKASGISLYKLLPPVLLLAAVAYILTAFTAIYALPKGNIAFKDLLYQVIQKRINLNLKEQTFNNSIPGLLIYIDRNDEKAHTLSGIMIQDERNPRDVSTIFAKSGSLGMDENTRKIYLRLSDGTIHQAREKGAYRRLEFKEYELSIDLSQGMKAYEKNELDMSLDELRKNLRTGGFSKKLTLDMGLEIHRRFTHPFACFIFAIVAMPLGIHNRRSGKAAGFTLSIVTLLLFYVVQSIGRTFAEKELLPMALAAWLPNILFLSLGIYLFIKAAKEESFGLIARISSIAGYFFRKRTGK
jgi:lipopolysaccharide export system permease protein